MPREPVSTGDCVGLQSSGNGLGIRGADEARNSPLDKTLKITTPGTIIHQEQQSQSGFLQVCQSAFKTIINEISDLHRAKQ